MPVRTIHHFDFASGAILRMCLHTRSHKDQKTTAWLFLVINLAEYAGFGHDSLESEGSALKYGPPPFTNIMRLLDLALRLRNKYGKWESLAFQTSRFDHCMVVVIAGVIAS